MIKLRINVNDEQLRDNLLIEKRDEQRFLSDMFKRLERNFTTPTDAHCVLVSQEYPINTYSGFI